MKDKHIYYFLIILFKSIGIYAQAPINDSIIELNEFMIKANRLRNFSSGSKLQNSEIPVLKQFKTQNLNDLIQSESSAFIKSYGPGNLSTTSIRGASANQTAIIFNGFNINSPMNGISDLSLIPVCFFDDMHIQYGGSGTLWGSGNIGGSIHLDNTPVFNKGINISAGSSIGSFNNLRHNFNIIYSGKKWTSKIKAFHLSAENDFPFYNTALSDTPLQYQTNSELKQTGLLFENFFKLDKSQDLELIIWYQNNEREIPPNMLKLEDKSTQSDESLRITTEWRKSFGQNEVYIRSALFNESILYEDISSETISSSMSSTVISEIEAKFKTGKDQLLSFGLNNTNTSAKADAYNGNIKQNRFSIFTLYKIALFNKKLESVFGLRQEMMSTSSIPITWSAGLKYTLSKWLSLNFNSGKVYRLPTLNDLYWVPGSNPNLLPESGYTSDLGLKFTISKKSTELSFCPNIFNRNISNWIIWLPEQTFWTPQNLMEVWSRGLETRTELNYTLKDLSVKLSLLSGYVLSTNEKKKSENDLSVGKQIIYVPIYSGTGKLSASYKSFKFCYSQSYTGYRYTSSDNSQYLAPYKLANIYMAYNFKFQKFNTDFFIRLNNIFNENYQVVMNRAMPLINYQLGVNFNFYQTKKTKK